MKTIITVQSLSELIAVANYGGCKVSASANAFSFPTTVTIYNGNKEGEMSFEEFKATHLNKE